ncbi:A-kinase anchor protein 17B [Rhinatrema bivittatum]|uniref:A-kinase anchor protein 17B n=1 Tax=Rhinatrema bivittatum TaxID=194408 RepID=UPI00112C517E|nr:A-kinase anchor protein 17B [Rhinatrema bivittatum]XP_029463461.1 A-kinase anchor protein 17B [Rhinatrema bivittatum]
MTITIVYDNSEAVELCASQSLYLTPAARLTISVMLPDCKEPTRSFSNWDLLDQLKSMISPDQFSSIRVSKSTKDFIRIEGEVETKHLAQMLQAKLHGKLLKLNGFLEGLHLETAEAGVDFPTQEEWEAFSKETAKEDLAEQSPAALPDSICLEGLPCKWFALKGSNSEKPSEGVLQMVFERFGKVKNTDIPMLDPYRDVTASGNCLGSVQTFEAFVQYEEHADFVKAMEALRGMKLMFQGEDGKALACNLKVTFDTSKHFSEEAIEKRNLERLKLQELEQQRKLEKEEEEAAERKRKSEERKARERKRKAKLRRKVQRQRQRARQGKQQKAVKAEDDAWLEESEEWDARKLLLAQRRVASIRLLTLLLAKVKDFVQLERLNEELLLDIEMEEEFEQETELDEMEIEEATSPPSPDDDWQAEEKPACQSSRKCEEEQEEGGGETEMPALSYRLRGALPKEHIKKELPEEKKHNGYSGSLQITFNRDCKEAQSSDREDYHVRHIPHPKRVPSPGSGTKPKVYETDEFIHYLLNYYQCPSYARICPVPRDPGSSSWWQRVVFHSGGGFRVLLKNTYERHFTQLKVGRALAQELYSSPEEGDYRNWKITIGKAKGDSGSKGLREEFQAQWFPEEFPEACGSPQQAPVHSMGYSPGRVLPRKRKLEPSCKRVCSAYELRDVLEEISSDSEYFSEERSGSERRRKSGAQGKEKPSIHNQVCMAREKPERPCLQHLDRRKRDAPDFFLRFGFQRQEEGGFCRCRLARSCKEQNSKSCSSQEEEESATCTRERQRGLQAAGLGDDDLCSDAEYWDPGKPETEWDRAPERMATFQLKPKAALAQLVPSRCPITSRVSDQWETKYTYNNKQDNHDDVNLSKHRRLCEHNRGQHPSNHSTGERNSKLGSCPKSFREFLSRGNCFYST